MNIRSERSGDYNPIDRVLYAAFRGEDEAALVRALRKSPGFIPQLSLVAETGDIVGYALFSRVRIQTADASIESLALAPMGVLPGFQRKGVGALLLREGIERCRKLGFHSIIVIGHPGYYPRFGFQAAKPKGLLLPFPAPDETFMALELTPGCLEGVRGAVVYPPAFLGVL